MHELFLMLGLFDLTKRVGMELEQASTAAFQTNNPKHVQLVTCTKVQTGVCWPACSERSIAVDHCLLCEVRGTQRLRQMPQEKVQNKQQSGFLTEKAARWCFEALHLTGQRKQDIKYWAEPSIFPRGYILCCLTLISPLPPRQICQSSAGVSEELNVNT